MAITELAMSWPQMKVSPIIRPVSPAVKVLASAE